MAIESPALDAAIKEISNQVLHLAQNCEGNNQLLLSLLRSLEKMHREIREGLFLESLPNSRHELEKMLKDIEENGGWPYIERMRIQQLLSHWSEDTMPNSTESETGGLT